MTVFCMVKIKIDVIITDVLRVSELPSTCISKIHQLTKNLWNSMYILVLLCKHKKPL